MGWLWLLSDVADDTMLFYKGARRGLGLAAESEEVKKVQGNRDDDRVDFSIECINSFVCVYASQAFGDSQLRIGQLSKVWCEESV